MNGEESAALVCNGYDLLKLLRVENNGLFGDNVLARAESLDGDLGVNLIGSRDGNELDLVVRKKLLEGLIRADAVGLCKLDLNGVDVVDTAKVSYVTFKNISGVPAAHSAVADDGAACFLYVFNFAHNSASQFQK